MVSREEAIRQIEDYRYCRGENEISIEACDMAIEALTDIGNIKKIQEAQNKLYKKIFEGGSFLPLPDCMLKEGGSDVSRNNQ